MAKQFAKLSTAQAKRVGEVVRAFEAKGPVKAPQVSAEPQSYRQILDAKITAAVAINGLIRWRYTIRFGHWDGATNPTTGGVWVEDDTTDYSAFNGSEDLNVFTTTTGTIGTGNTGVKQSDGTIGTSACKLLPLPVGACVQVKPRYFGSDNKPYFTIINFANSAQS